MDIRNITLVVVAVISAVFSLIVIKSEKNRANSAFTLFVLCVAFWSLGLALFRMVNGFQAAYQITKMYYIAAAGIPTFFLYFSLSFPKEKSLSSWDKFFIFSPFSVLSLLTAFYPNFIIQSIFEAEWGKDVLINKKNYLVYGVYFVSYVVLAFYYLAKSYRETKEIIIRKQLNLIFAGTVMPYVLAMFTNLLLPWFTYRYVWIGPLVAIIMVVAISYAISRHKLLDVKVIATEFFTAILFIVLVLRFIVSEKPSDYLFNGIILLLSSVFCIFLIRSVWKEVRTREELQVISEQLATANEKLKQLDQAKTEFISIASHQLRTPLTAIKGYSSMILEGSFGPATHKVREIVQKVFDSSQKLVLIIGNFLDVSRIELGKMQYEYATFDLRELIKTVVDETAVIIKKSPQKSKVLEITFEAQSAAEYLVYADQGKIQQVMSNLVDNAMKYTDRGSIAVRLERDAAKNVYRVTIKDTGIGIPKKIISSLFQKFTRGNSLSNMHSSGSGLGLYVAKEIVKEHKGEVWAESEGVGKGSSFFVELPFIERRGK